MVLLETKKTVRKKRESKKPHLQKSDKTEEENTKLNLSEHQKSGNSSKPIKGKKKEKKSKNDNPESKSKQDYSDDAEEEEEEEGDGAEGQANEEDNRYKQV